jgi:hypothetical protein
VSLGTGGDACRYVATHFKGSALTWWRSYAKNSFTVFDSLTLDVLLTDLK